MNTWRNKGYVPDSDDDEDFESQESRKGYIEEQGPKLDDDDGFGLRLTGSDEDKNSVENGEGVEEYGQYSESAELRSSHGSYNDDEDESAREKDQELQSVELNLNDGGYKNNTHDGDHEESYHLPSVGLELSNESDTLTPPETEHLLAKSASAIEPLLADDEITSSDDELQLISVVPNNPATVYTTNSADIPNDELRFQSESDSPLSSAPSVIVSPDSSPQFPQSHGDQHSQSQQTVVPQRKDLAEEDALSQILANDILALDSELQPQRRSLRERKEIQMHPYLIEDAKYQSLVRKAGLKPVRVVTAESAARRPQEESQETIIGVPEPPSSPASEFIFPPSSPPDPCKSPASTSRQPIPKDKSQSEHDHVQPHSQKRRKLFHDSQVKKHKQQFPSFKVVIQKADTFVSTNTTQSVQAPLSPPRSGSVSSVAHVGKDGFRFPRGFTPPAKTFDTTAQSASRDATDLTIDEDFDSDAPLDAEDDHISSQTSIEDNEPEEVVSDMAVRQYQRRIKGVLPASWLTLDLKNKGGKTSNSSSERHQRELVSTRAEPQKGVARPISRPRNTALESLTPRATFAFLEDSSDSDDTDLNASATVDIQVAKESRKTSAGSRKFHDLTNDVDEDIPEDNTLEEIFSPVRRSVFGHNRSHSSIPKTYKRKQVSYKNNQPQKSRPLRQMHLDDSTPRPSKRKVRRPQIPNLSILDAPDVARRPRKEQPHFLRVATRQVRSRKDQGRSSPTRKVFNMATREETKETNKALWDWKKGSMKQAKLSMTSTPRSARQPLQSLSTNRLKRTDRVYTSTLPQSSVSDERPRFLQELDLTSENLTFAQPLAIPPMKSRVVSTTMKQSRLVRKNVISRTHAITSLRRDGPRPVESEIVGREGGLSPYAFSASLAALDKDRKRTFTLDRYISALEPPDPNVAQLSRPDIQPIPETLENEQPARQKPPRKRIPARAEVIVIDPMPQITASSEPAKRTNTTPVDNTKRLSNTLFGFGNISIFSVDFNILPIRKGTYFHDSTLIGECGLSRSLNINERNMDRDAGFATIDLGDQVFRWGPWNEQVSSELGVIMDFLKNDIEKYGSLPEISSNSDSFRVLVFVIRWITDTMHFIDPIDRVSFIERVELLIGDLRNHIAMASHANQSGWQVYLRLASLNIILANQIRQVASHELVNTFKRENTVNLVKTVSRQLSSLMYNHHGLQDIRQFNERNQDVNLESGIRHDYPAVEAHIVLFQILHSSHDFQGWFNEFALLSFADKTSSSNIQHFEEVWEAVFTTLPLYEIDACGLGRPGLRFRDKYDQWPIVQKLVSKVLDTYYLDSDQPSFYINYCRILFQRCLLLMVYWSWRHCKGILETLFDFYAKNVMYNLKTEQSFGSPSFLEALDTNPSIEIEPNDSSFHLFLKILGSGLRYLSQVHDTKTMRNITWRLLPNHGRVYPKEKPLAHEDLDALRNHHDLLCTLYWAVPANCRPRLQTIRNVIDPATSHLETINLSIRSWRRLVHFKLSTNEEDADLKHFADWYNFFASGIVRQHQLAKTEVEAQAKNQMHFSKQDIESTVSHNQRQIEALISSTITAMDSAIQSSRSFSQACLLVEGFPIVKLVELFDPVNSRTNHIICDSLQLIIKFLAKDLPLVNSANSPARDDSQEYGDWSALEEVFDDGVTESAAAPTTTFPYLQEVIRPCVSRLLSNCFGEDRPPEDSLLLKVTECWSALAHASVRSGLEHWDSYLNPYNGNSWTALRMTPQTKKFGPQFLANCIENDSQFFSECRLQILTMWVSCLVERTSALKFQHRLTEVLLNEDQTLLMKNLPFNRGADGRYHISLSELTDRRISLISSLLSNMREHLQTQDNSGSVNTTAIDEYRELIMAMMATMKTNYQELGQSGKTARGQYIEFVHDIISFMQQHTQSICPIDRFFTDPSTFPLPPGDPGLVVAKLKGYGIRLPATKAAKELVNFMQGICESAALDDRQDELVAQLCESMGETYESGDTANPTLRSFLLHCLFPAYIECSLSSAAAWIFVLPVMKATSRATRDLLYDIDINDADCVESVNSMFGAILRAIREVMCVFIQDADYTEETRALLIIKSCIDVISAMVPILDYFDRNGHTDDHNMAILEKLRTYTAFIVERLFEPSTVVEDQHDTFPEELTDKTHVNSLFLEHRTYAIRQVQTYLRTNWSKHNGRYFVRRGREPREVETEIMKSKEIVAVHHAKSSLVEAADMCLHRWESFTQPDGQSRSDAFGEPKIKDASGELFNDFLL